MAERTGSVGAVGAVGAASADLAALVACHDCDLLQRRKPLRPGDVARCGRCGAVLYRASRDVFDRTIAFSVASAALLTVVLAFPFLEFRFGGRVETSHLATGAYRLWAEGFPGLGALVLLTSVAGPAALVTTLLLVCAPLRAGRTARWIAPLCRLLRHLRPWSMMEVYLLGVIVAIVKLGQMADIVLGPAAYAFFALILTLTAAVGAFDAHAVWDRLDRR